jgi:hypothetical protein
MRNLGDKIMGLDSTNPKTQQLLPESNCSKRKAMLNEGRYADTFYDIFWSKQQPKQ